MEAGGGDDFDLDVEFAFEGRELLPAFVLERVRQLGVELDPDASEAAGDRPGLDPPQDVEPDELGAGDGAGATAGRAGAVGAELEGLFEPLTVDLQKTVF